MKKLPKKKIKLTGAAAFPSESQLFKAAVYIKNQNSYSLPPLTFKTMNDKVLLEARQLLSGFLKQRREELGITQEKLAELSGMGVATIRRFECGRFWLNMKQLLLLADALDCDLKFVKK